MFGHSDNNQQQDDPMGGAHDDIAASAEAFANDRGTAGQDNNSGGGTLGTFMSAPEPNTIAPTVSLGAPAPTDLPSLSPATDAPVQGIAPAPLPQDAGLAPAAVAAPGTNDLLDIKHEALQALTPLVSQLNQTPEEQFRTTMMMIQASDNHNLIKVAYEAAQKISNEKERAQALLDIVNEINYFTQQA